MQIVGIAGPSGSGKSILCRNLAEKLSGSRILQQDWYFIDPDGLPDDANFCEPDYLHISELVDHVLTLKAGKAVRVPRMNMRTFKRTGEFDLIDPCSYLLLEGMTIFRIPELYGACDRRLYISPGIAAIRRRKWRRDLTERSKTRAEVRRQLKWVEQEYAFDLACLPPDVCVLDGVMDPTRICRLALQHIVS